VHAASLSGRLSDVTYWTKWPVNFQLFKNFVTTTVQSVFDGDRSYSW